MDAKIRFGVDYLNIMANANMKAGDTFDWKAYNLSRMMLCWEWGFTSKEEDEANRIFFEMIDKKTVEELGDVANRVVEHVKNNEEAKTRLIVDMMMVNLMDGNVTSEEADLTISFANDLDFRKSEISKMEQKANDLLMVLKWFIDNYNKIASSK